jgi:phosphatidylglycerol lysyltransferase
MERFSFVKKIGRHFGVLLSLVLFAAALAALHHLLEQVHLREVLEGFRGTPGRSIVAAAFCTACSYLALTGYDGIGLRYLGRSLPFGRVALASFTSYTFSHNIGLSLLTGGSIRYRIYSAVGLSATEIASLTAFCGLTFALSTALLLGLALTAAPHVLLAADGMPLTAHRVAGVAILVLVAAYVVAAAVRKKPLRLGHWSLPAPGLSITSAQIAIGVIDICCAVGALYLVLPLQLQNGFPTFAGVYVAAMTIGVISHVPGGLGVFEAFILLAFPAADKGALLGALLVYRCLYYLLPLILAAALLAGHELRLRRERFSPAFSTARRLVRAVAPHVIGLAVLAGGAILLFSGATPILRNRLALLRHVVPLPFIETSHMLGSVIGFILLILSRGLFRRLDGAFHLAVVMLGGGIVFSIFKGFDYEEAVVMLVLLILLVACRDSFYRKASLLNQSFSVGWVATIVVIVAASIWLGFFSFKHVEYSESLWWEFAYRADAPRFLRASVVVTVLLLGFQAFLLLRPASRRLTRDKPDPALISSLVAGSPRAEANLALTGDKLFLFPPEEDAFLMYQIKGRSWVALGDPVGSRSSWERLLWSFRELCDCHDGWPVFYQIGAESLPFYLDLGLSLLKIGEEARVDLSAFSLEEARKDIRYSVRRAVREGAEFRMVPAAEVPELFSELRSVSDEWLRLKSTSEKGFSIGFFSEEYLRRSDCAVVTKAGKIVAFANVWRAPAGGEMSIDLMRHRADAPYGIMDYLFVQLMLTAREEGYRWFNLGMVPLSGLDTHPLGPVWNRIGNFIFRQGEYFYNFEGLRAYKEKFNPVWAARYLAAPGGLALPRIFLDIAALISGGTREIFRK